MYVFMCFQRAGKGGRNRGRETSMCGCLSHASPPRGPACNPGLHPDWELNQQPFGSQASAQATEPHQPGHRISFCHRRDGGTSPPGNENRSAFDAPSVFPHGRTPQAAPGDAGPAGCCVCPSHRAGAWGVRSGCREARGALLGGRPLVCLESQSPAFPAAPTPPCPLCPPVPPALPWLTSPTSPSSHPSGPRLPSWALDSPCCGLSGCGTHLLVSKCCRLPHPGAAGPHPRVVPSVRLGQGQSGVGGRLPPPHQPGPAQHKGSQA
ncbi:hypothetical protein HJG60_008113 [Phyllostomus discolor]|uniref:Uncharacterized protein n=1 Tax=Phyllostomus discolor TaxID=89673 RepID=A0A833Z3S0_9CHIR|nr:hypothetical protein HJG60_008113 [Phyllostomus discolor]